MESSRLLGTAAVAGLGLSEPLLPAVPAEVSVRYEGDNLSDVDSKEKKSDSNVFVTALICIISGAGFASSAAAMVSAQVAIVFVAGGLCCLNAPSVIHRQYTILKSPNLRKSISMLRCQLNELTASVAFLETTIDTLQDVADDAKVVEAQLKSIAEKQGSNVLELVALVRENENILDTMKYNLRESFVAEMAKIIVRSDKDGDMTVDPAESDLLALRLQIQLKPHGVELDTIRFKQVIEENNDIGHLLKFCSEVLYPDIALENQNRGKETDLYLGDSSIQSSYEDEDDFFEESPRATGRSTSKVAPGDLAGFCKKLSMMTDEELREECDDVKLTIEDKLDMFSIDSMYSKGSVECARGRKMSILPGAQIQKKHARASVMAAEAQQKASQVGSRVKGKPKSGGTLSKSATATGGKKSTSPGKIGSKTKGRISKPLWKSAVEI